MPRPLSASAIENRLAMLEREKREVSLSNDPDRLLKLKRIKSRIRQTKLRSPVPDDVRLQLMTR